MIALRGVSHSFEGRSVLTDLDLDLSERRIGVVGSNGSGKSTFARLLNGLVVPRQGTVTIDGLDTRRNGAAVRRRVGFVFTDPDAQIVMPTVAEDIAFSLRRSSVSPVEREARVTAVLERFGLLDHRDHPCHALSGGQKQLLALAAVLVTDPDVLVLDEPTTLLDLRNSARIATLLDELPQQLVVVTHQLDLVAAADRVVVFDDGRVVADDSPAVALPAYRALMAAS